MPVNTAALKTFAPAMRRQLLEAVGRKLDLLLNSQTPDTLSTYAKQIAELREQEADNREQLLERVAYTWFNRLCALRYLDARGWHPFGCKVLMPAGEGDTQPELLKLMRAGSLPAELKTHTNEGRLHGLLDGQIPTAITGADPQGEVYRELVLASCRSYHHLLLNLFEGLDDATELLLPDDLLTEGSIAGRFRNEISDEDCQDVEIIGWLYQFYISEKKDEVIGKVVKSEDIPAATQLFTPNWIVKYMVQNSLGAQWLATYPASALKGQMEYYIEPAEQTDEVKSQLAAISPETLNPEDLTLIDPACGSGHILAEAYELFKAIYLERGYQLREIPQLILQKNLYGLDIDERAAQLTSFALMMKGREDDRRLFECGVKLNVMALQNSASVNVERLAANVDLATAGVSRADVLMLVELFAHASTSGSLIEVPSVLADKLPALKRLAEQSSQDLFASGELQQLEALARQADALSRRYDSVVANPPYMGSKYLSGELKEYVKYSYPDSKGDVFACFIDRSTTLAKTTGRIGIVAPYVWMFIASYQKLREKLIANTAFDTLIQLEYNAFEPAMVPVASFTLLNQHVPGVFGAFIRLSDFKGSQNQSPKVLEAISNPECGWFHRACADSFLRMPGSPIGYWITELMIQAFSGPSLGEIFAPSAGITTGNNAKYLRLWHELNAGSILHDLIPGQQPPAHGFVPHMKGGSFRRWYGNFDYCLAFSTQSIASMQKEKGYRPDGAEHFFKPMLSWSKLTVGPFSARYVRGGAAFDTTGTSGFSCSSLMRIIGLLNSKVAQDILDLLNPTLTYLPRDIKSIPWVEVNSEIPSQCVKLCIKDWNAFERSWEFKASPLVSRPDQQKSTLSTANDAWTEECKQATRELKHLEESNNIDYIHAYGLDGQLSPLVAIDAVTLTGNPAYRYGANLSEKEQWSRFRRDTMAEFLSYATGCMMGRYSLDQPGLILADSRESQATHLAAYEEKVGKPLAEVRFKPDPDAILPVLDGEWFEDDIVARTREFLEVTFPESTVTENLRFIEESLGKDIRKYFCTDFYKDHLQTYKKRPIYWMVQSPKKGFACLIYLHRYTKDTLNQVLNNYFRPYLQKLEARLAQLGLDQLNDDLPTRERTAARKEAEKITKVLRECQVWEKDALLPLAQQRIELDLDDGVKVNYLKLQDVLAPIPGLAAKED